MKIQRTSLTSTNPRVLEELLVRKSISFHNEPRGFRKPLGIYNVSLANISGSLEDVLDELDHVLNDQTFRQIPPTVEWDKVLMRRQEYFVRQLMRYFDDCLSLLSCFYPKIHTKTEEDKKYVMKQQAVE